MIASEIFIWVQYHPDALRSSQLLTFNLSYLIVLTYGSDILMKIESWAVEKYVRFFVSLLLFVSVTYHVYP